jgi:hypothetical protein
MDWSAAALGLLELDTRGGEIWRAAVARALQQQVAPSRPSVGTPLIILCRRRGEESPPDHIYKNLDE